MAVLLGSLSWPPSDFQAGRPINSDRPGDSALQRVANALNRSWLDCANYLFAYPSGLSPSATTNVTLNGGLTATAFRFRAHNPVGLVNLRFIVEGRYVGGTGAVVRLKEGGVTIATATLTTSFAASTTFGTVASGDQTYTIEVETQASSVATVRNIWVSWGDFV